jgi:hypothetical protein
LTICNSFLPIGNNFAANDEHNHYELIYEAITFSLQTSSCNNFVVIDEHNHYVPRPPSTHIYLMAISEQIHYVLTHEDIYHLLQHQG